MTNDPFSNDAAAANDNELFRHAMPYMMPADQVDAIDKLIELGNTEPGVGQRVWSGFSEIDSINLPWHAGRLILALGETGHGKSPWMKSLARNIEWQILAAKRDSYVVSFLTEDTAQKHALYMAGAAAALRPMVLGQKIGNIEALRARIGASRQIVVGGAIKLNELIEAGSTRGGRSREAMMTPNKIAQTINHMMQMGIQIEAVLIDHAHDLFPDEPYRGESERHDKVADALVRMSVAMEGVCPLIIACQVNKDVDSRPPLLRQPDVNDVKFMAALGTRAADVITISHPAKYPGVNEPRKDGSTIKFRVVNGGEMEPIFGNFIVKLAKGRDASSNPSIWMTGFDEKGKWTGLLTESRTKRIPLSDLG